mmetsp:Transcript_77291/g.218557  ORF Transcript_77291/g.218557 Transcript_77291/m.218557 type:complete len:202 (+) Transcript_77291:855-1460(+)
MASIPASSSPLIILSASMAPESISFMTLSDNMTELCLTLTAGSVALWTTSGGTELGSGSPPWALTGENAREKLRFTEEQRVGMGILRNSTDSSAAPRSGSKFFVCSVPRVTRRAILGAALGKGAHLGTSRPPSSSPRVVISGSISVRRRRVLFSSKAAVRIDSDTGDLQSVMVEQNEADRVRTAVSPRGRWFCRNSCESLA